jgi:hypothetical protein
MDAASVISVYRRTLLVMMFEHSFFQKILKWRIFLRNKSHPDEKDKPRPVHGRDYPNKLFPVIQCRWVAHNSKAILRPHRNCGSRSNIAHRTLRFVRLEYR